MRTVWLVLWWCSVAGAEPCPQLRHEVRRAERWNDAWRLLLTSGTVLQAAVAATPPVDGDTRRAALVGAAESFVGAAGIWIAPLRIDAGGTCEEAAAVERRTFWMLHAGNLVVNATGGVVLAEMTDWSRGAVSFALGYAVGLVQIYTMPRMHDAHVSAAVVPGGGGGWTVSIEGAF